MFIWDFLVIYIIYRQVTNNAGDADSTKKAKMV